MCVWAYKQGNNRRQLEFAFVPVTREKGEGESVVYSVIWGGWRRTEMVLTLSSTCVLPTRVKCCLKGEAQPVCTLPLPVSVVAASTVALHVCFTNGGRIS